MSKHRDKRRRARRCGLVAAAVIAAASLAISSTAIAGQDQLKGGSVQFNLAGSRGLKLSPNSLTLPITGGQVDPINGSGTVLVNGTFRAKSGKHKAKVTITSFTFGANGGAGSLAAKVGKRKVSRFGVLSGGKVTRDGWGAKITGVTATLGSKGAKALASGSSGKGGHKAQAAGGKGGQSLGTVSATTVPRAVEVKPGGTLVFNADMSFATKLMAHCINGLLPGGVEAIPPATQNLTVFTAPVTGGSISPDFTAGRVTSAGGQKIAKNSTLVPADCSGGVPAGTTITQTEFEAQFDLQALASFTVVPTGPIGVGALGKFDLGAASSKSADPSSKQVTISDAPIHLDPLTAYVLNQVFPTESGNSSDDFAGGDLVGTLSLNVTTH